jgi:hypothetical protein
MRTKYNLRQKRERLEREIQHFIAQVARFSPCSTPQERRCHTRAMRCLRRRMDDMAKLS